MKRYIPEMWLERYHRFWKTLTDRKVNLAWKYANRKAQEYDLTLLMRHFLKLRLIALVLAVEPVTKFRLCDCSNQKLVGVYSLANF